MYSKLVKISWRALVIVIWRDIRISTSVHSLSYKVVLFICIRKLRAFRCLKVEADLQLYAKKLTMPGHVGLFLTKRLVISQIQSFLSPIYEAKISHALSIYMPIFNHISYQYIYIINVYISVRVTHERSIIEIQ